jgi:uncharacterized cupredoxin-like copper-binding protein
MRTVVPDCRWGISLKPSALVMLAVLFLSQLGACGTGERESAIPTGTPAEKEPFLGLKTTEYKFDALPTFKGGLVTIELDNTAGKEAHEAEFLRLDPGKKPADYVAAIAQKRLPSFAHPAGGPGPVLAGKTAIYTGNFPAGNYIFVCHVPAPDNQEHQTKGMISEIRLSEGREASLPRANETIGAKEFEFTGGGKLKAGSQTVKVINEGQQPHNFGLVSLAPGKKASDLSPYLVPPGSPFPPGPPPFTGFNGLVGTVSPGDAGTRTLELSPKTSYALICFVPDADGTPHFAKGMIEQVDIP